MAKGIGPCLLGIMGFATATYTLITYTRKLSGSLTVGSYPSGYAITPGEIRLVVE